MTDLIRTWDELLAAKIALTQRDVTFAFSIREPGLAADFTGHLAIVHHHPDGLLRFNYMLHIFSVPHTVYDDRLMLVVVEGPRSDAPSFGPYLEYSIAGYPHYRTAEDLGLDGMPHSEHTYSVLIPHSKLELIEFTNASQPLAEWELEQLDPEIVPNVSQPWTTGR